MPFSPPNGAAVNFWTEVAGPVYEADNLTIVFANPDGYVAPYGQAVNFQFPGEYVPPPGNQAHFEVEASAVSGDGSVVASFSAAGAGAHGVAGVGAGSWHPVAAGNGAHGVGGAAAVVGVFPANGVGVAPPAGNGAVTARFSADGSGEHSAPPVSSGLRRVSSVTTNSWRRANECQRVVDNRIPAAASRNRHRAAPWAVGAPAARSADMRWPKTRRVDTDRAGSWGRYARTAKTNSLHAWPAAIPLAGIAGPAWGATPELKRPPHTARWNKPIHVDTTHVPVWHGFLIPAWRIIPYVRPAGGAADFNVAGGGVDFYLDLLTAYTQTGPHAIRFDFPAGTYIPPVIYYPDYVYDVPGGIAADFLYNLPREPVLDSFGNPVFTHSSRHASTIAPWGQVVQRDIETMHPWLFYSRRMNPGWGVVIPGGPQPTPPGESIIIPVRRAYIVVNEILLTRAADGTPIPASGLSIQFDCDSWLPSFTATVPEAARDIVMPDPSPVEIYAFINGSEFKFFVEKVARTRQFAKRSVTISGRGIACELAAPYAPAAQHTNTTSMTAQQLIDAALEFTGYTQTWNITDWLVPTGVLSLAGTPADVANHVAEAAGAVLAADWLDRDLRMLPRYPVKPWNWATATPDYVIPAAVTQTESVEWIEKPSYNLVYVSGIQAGVLGQVKIYGTAGDSPAPMVTHPLTTHDDAARQRGTSILSDTGRKALMQITLPVLEETGVIDLCRLIEFSDGANTRRGITRANQVSVNWPTVRQTVTIEAAP